MMNIDEFAKKYRANLERLKAMSDEEKQRNAGSHQIGVVDDRYGCVECEISPHSAWKNYCPAMADSDRKRAMAMHPAGKGI